MASRPSYNSINSDPEDPLPARATRKKKLELYGPILIVLVFLGLPTILYSLFGNPQFRLLDSKLFVRLPESEIALLFEAGKIPPVEAVAAPQSLISHRTHRYRFNQTDRLLVFRRGCPFVINVTVWGQKGSLDESVEPYAQNSINQHFLTNITGKILNIDQQQDFVVYTIEISTPSDGVVDGFNLTLCFARSDEDGRRCFRASSLLVLLFNPYNPLDQVFMEDLGEPVLLPEYLENEYGTVWRGSLNEIAPQRWYYAQFDEWVIHAALYLLQNFTGDGSNPVEVSRWFTYVLSAGDDGIPGSQEQSAPSGVLLGKWFGNYSDGVEPDEWMDSRTIYKKYLKTKQTVRYGQCWVYAAIMNSILRTVGIPSRQLVTFNSAHESPRGIIGFYSHVINKYYDANTGRVIHMDGSVWNFHSWNDAWMKRPDLGRVYDGWQAVDATPQETSLGRYQCGPAPLHAIYEMQDEVEWDASFVISEVSARIRRFTGKCSGTWLERRCTRDEDLGYAPLYESNVAALMATPAVGSNGNTMSDVSFLYHVPIPSPPATNDTNATDDTNPTGPTPMTLPALPDGHLSGDFRVSMEVLCDLIGEPIEVRATFSRNKDSKLNGEYHIGYHIHGYFSDYTGNSMDYFASREGDVTLNEDNEWTVTTTVSFPFADYYQDDPITQQFSFDVFGRVTETNQVVVDTQPIDLRDPPILITAAPVINIAKDSTKGYPVTFSFRNSLPIPLHDCRMKIQAVGMGLTKTINITQEVPASGGGTIAHKDKFVPTIDSVGTNSIMAYMSCKEINDLHGDTSVQVVQRG